MPSLDDKHPELALQWHPTRNGKLTPQDVTPGSSKDVWWLCDAKHEWSARVAFRSKGRGCPYCENKRKPGRAYGKLTDIFPELAAEWHPERNDHVDIDSLTIGSNRIVWWRCSTESNHEWKASVRNRCNGLGRCPKCRWLPGEGESLAERRPEIANDWHRTRNGSLTPEDVFPQSRHTVWWQCAHDPKHVWQAQIRSRTRGTGKCPRCARQSSRRLPSLDKANPELVNEWHPNLNAPLTPRAVTAGSGRRVWWQCQRDPTHVWATAVSNRARRRTGCPECASTPDSGTSLADLHPELVAEWHSSRNEGLTPSQLTPGSNRKVWWQCVRDSSHRPWETYVFMRAKGRGSCPTCRKESRRLLKDEYPEIAEEWHPSRNSHLDLGDVTYASGRKIWWQCRINPDHEWQAEVRNRTLNKTGCPHCHREAISSETYKYIASSSLDNTSYWSEFDQSLRHISSLLQLRVDDQELDQTLLRLAYAHIVTVVETYLADCFINTVLNNDLWFNRLMQHDQTLSTMKVSGSDLMSWYERRLEIVTDHLASITFHNLAKVEKLYRSVLAVSFPPDMDDIYRAIAIRHDIVHRNGRSKSGQVVVVDRTIVKNLIEQVRGVVSEIDTQVTELRRTR